MHRLFACLLVAGLTALATAAPVPKEKPNPFAEKLIGTWHYNYAESSEDALLPFGTATPTFAPGGKVTATFGGGYNTGLFRDTAGTYTLIGDTLTTRTVTGKGTPDEYSSEVTWTIIDITPDRLRVTFSDDKQKRVTVFERVKPARMDEKK